MSSHRDYNICAQPKLNIDKTNDIYLKHIHTASSSSNMIYGNQCQKRYLESTQLIYTHNTIL